MEEILDATNLLRKRCMNDSNVLSDTKKKVSHFTIENTDEKASAISRRLLSSKTTHVLTPISLQSQWAEPGTTSKTVTV